MKNMKSICIFLVVIVIIGVVITIVKYNNRITIEDCTLIEYKVKKNDSLYKIACEYCPKSIDRYEWIDAVRKINKINKDYIIQPDETIQIYVFEKGE